jgi:hypothetical protein
LYLGDLVVSYLFIIAILIPNFEFSSLFKEKVICNLRLVNEYIIGNIEDYQLHYP